MLSTCSRTRASSGPVSPPFRPCGSRQDLSFRTHSWSCSPPLPSGSSSDGSGPAMKPSAETEMSILVLLMPLETEPPPKLIGLDLADRDHAPLVGADADRAIAFGHLDVEVQLAVVDDLAQRCSHLARRALRRGGDVLDADLEAHGRPAVREILERENRRAALHHPDHPRGREDADADRAADVGDQPVLDGELVDPLHPRLEAH